VEGVGKFGERSTRVGYEDGRHPGQLRQRGLANDCNRTSRDCLADEATSIIREAWSCEKYNTRPRLAAIRDYSGYAKMRVANRLVFRESFDQVIEHALNECTLDARVG
jgi:hypothetical protein